MRNYQATMAALMLATGWVASAQADAEQLTRTFEVADGGQLEVKLDFGEIEVQPGKPGQVVFTARVRGADADKFEFDFRQDGSDIRVRGELTDRKARKRSSSISVSVRVEVPAHFDLDLDTSGGSIDVGDIDGEVVADTAGGSIVIGRVTGPVRADTAGGAIEVLASKHDVDADTAGGSIDLGEIFGRVKADTAGGAIRVERAHGHARLSTAGGGIRVDQAYAAVDADTVGGGVKVNFLGQPDDRSNLSTTGGSITVGVADGVGFDLRAKSGVRVKSDFALPVDKDSPGRLDGAVNGGGPRLSVSSSGRIRIQKL
ncbi:MAG: DUF4097 family beta strand repeat-containing protein [Gammaproteobacteria bacterium]